MAHLDLRKELEEIFWNINRFAESTAPQVQRQVIRIIGQMALFLADLPFPVTASMDLDVVSEIDPRIQRELDLLLIQKGFRLETGPPRSLMPPETTFRKIFSWPKVEVQIADPDSVIVSKAMQGRPKDRKLILTYAEFFPAVRKRL